MEFFLTLEEPIPSLTQTKGAGGSGAEDSGHCSSDAPAAQAQCPAWRPAPPSRRHCWKRSRPALRVPSVVLSSAARYSLSRAPGLGCPPPLPWRLAPGGVRGVAVPSRAPVPERTRPPLRGDWGWASFPSVGSVSSWPPSQVGPRALCGLLARVQTREPPPCGPGGAGVKKSRAQGVSWESSRAGGPLTRLSRSSQPRALQALRRAYPKWVEESS